MRSTLKSRQIRIAPKIKQDSFLAHIEKQSKEIPPPASYDPKYTQVEHWKNSKIGFGVGMRMVPSLKLASARKSDGMFLNISDSELRMSPGPGAYKISSQFDR